MNQVTLLGRLGQDPDLNYTQTGTPVCNLSIATNKRWTDDQGQKQEKTEWHRAVAFGKQGETIAQYLKKGRQLLVQGELQTRSWDKDGETRYTTEVLVRSFEFVGDAPTETHQAAPTAAAPTQSRDDLPF